MDSFREMNRRSDEIRILEPSFRPDQAAGTLSGGEQQMNGFLDDRVAIAEFGWWEDCPSLGREVTRPIGSQTSNINDALSRVDLDCRIGRFFAK